MTIPVSGAVEIQRSVTKDGKVNIGGGTHLVGFAWAGRKIMLRLDGHLMHAIADNALLGSWPCSVGADRLASLPGAWIPSTALPPPPLPAGSLRAQRKVHESGRIMVVGQGIKVGPRHRGKLVTHFTSPEPVCRGRNWILTGGSDVVAEKEARRTTSSIVLTSVMVRLCHVAEGDA